MVTKKEKNEANIALVGDPGVAKSQRMAYAAFISPRGMFALGKGISMVGVK